MGIWKKNVKKKEKCEKGRKMWKRKKTVNGKEEWEWERERKRKKNVKEKEKVITERKHKKRKKKKENVKREI
jgi:hypothetical protein